MKTKSKAELIELAVAVFENHPDQDSCFAREDGNIFFTENHSLLGKGDLKIFTFERNIIVTETPKLAVAKQDKSTKEKSDIAETTADKAATIKVDEAKKAEPTIAKTDTAKVVPIKAETVNDNANKSK